MVLNPRTYYLIQLEVSFTNFFLPLVIIVSLSTDRDVESPGRQSLGVSVRTFLDSLFAMSQSNCE